MPKVTSVLLLVLSTCYVGSLKAQALVVESFNLRYDNPADGANAWPHRRAMVKEHLQNLHPDLVGLQEVLAHQWQWLGQQLPEYGQLGVGRDDGKQAGEFVPVLYRLDRLELKKNGYFWLSETPDKVGSIGPGAHLPRITSWALFYDKQSQNSFCFFNTHFSHVSDNARQHAAKLLLAQITNLCEGLPVVISGDFNASPSDTTYQLLTERLSDTADKLAPATFNGFGKAKSAARIDYIFTDKAIGSSQYQTHQVIKDGVYISDHFPISAKLIF
ncbi:endonuclease/exonuclease/phosphatase family protein [Bowmanella yangjiangensis]|uniref:Endonuclease/exonuclease/phosphatase family protein n=1 Tax=Bowmanella yangjiangensis TaxID=2811230 RepID=A0ABS3CT17_9ALTE|nr:endonuclease/exonuclease/phosphatase family protein [Bowmanella yangjiangensis]MBN7820267.1 endonuclease/exonuclease/phosphatase family protein [Bowmanella yangjiangensis]